MRVHHPMQGIAATMHTGRFEVRQALQRRQISKDNIDGTYTVNLFKNMKHQSVEEQEHARFFCGRTSSVVMTRTRHQSVSLVIQSALVCVVARH